MTYEVYTFVLHVLLNALVVDPLKQPPGLIYASPMETSEEDVSLRVVPEMDEGRYSNIMVLTKKSGGGGGLGNGGTWWWRTRRDPRTFNRIARTRRPCFGGCALILGLKKQLLH